MYDHRPPVDWPSCSCTSTCSSTVQPCPPASTGNDPPWSRAAIAARRIGSPQSRRDAPAGPLELDLARLEHIPDECAGTRLQLELGGGQRQVHPGKDAPPWMRRVRPVAGRETARPAGRADSAYCGWASTMIRISVMSSMA